MTKRCPAGKAASGAASTPSSWDIDGKAPEAPELGYLGDRQLIQLADGGGGGGALTPLAMVRCAICLHPRQDANPRNPTKT